MVAEDVSVGLEELAALIVEGSSIQSCDGIASVQNLVNDLAAVDKGWVVAEGLLSRGYTTPFVDNPGIFEVVLRPKDADVVFSSRVASVGVSHHNDRIALGPGADVISNLLDI